MRGAACCISGRCLCWTAGGGGYSNRAAKPHAHPDLNSRNFIWILWTAALLCGLMAMLMSRGSNVELWGDAAGQISFDNIGNELWLGFLIACGYMASRLLHRLPMTWEHGVGMSHAANALPAGILILVMFALLVMLLIGAIFNLTYSHWWVSGVTLFALTVFDEDWKGQKPE